MESTLRYFVFRVVVKWPCQIFFLSQVRLTSSCLGYSLCRVQVARSTLPNDGEFFVLCEVDAT